MIRAPGRGAAARPPRTIRAPGRGAAASTPRTIRAVAAAAPRGPRDDPGRSAAFTSRCRRGAAPCARGGRDAAGHGRPSAGGSRGAPLQAVAGTAGRPGQVPWPARTRHLSSSPRHSRRRGASASTSRPSSWHWRSARRCWARAPRRPRSRRWRRSASWGRRRSTRVRFSPAATKPVPEGPHASRRQRKEITQNAINLGIQTASARNPARAFRPVPLFFRGPTLAARA